MSAEEFTDTVFSKIDINGDGEGTRGGGRGVGEGGLRGGGVSRHGGHPFPGEDRGPLLVTLPSTFAWATELALGIPASDSGFWIPLSTSP